MSGAAPSIARAHPLRRTNFHWARAHRESCSLPARNRAGPSTRASRPCTPRTRGRRQRRWLQARGSGGAQSCVRLPFKLSLDATCKHSLDRAWLGSLLHWSRDAAPVRRGRPVRELRSRVRSGRATCPSATSTRTCPRRGSAPSSRCAMRCRTSPSFRLVPRASCSVAASSSRSRPGSPIATTRSSTTLVAPRRSSRIARRAAESGRAALESRANHASRPQFRRSDGTRRRCTQLDAG